jgi:hypothetical protein
MPRKLRPAKKPAPRVKAKKNAADRVVPLISVIAYLIQKSRRRNMTRTITAEAWLQNFFSRKRYQRSWSVKYKTIN